MYVSMLVREMNLVFMQGRELKLCGEVEGVYSGVQLHFFFF